MQENRYKLIQAAVTSLILYLVSFVLVSVVHAHHVLGRPAYSLNEDSNTPPSMQVEVQVGEYFVTYMVYPAFPSPGEAGRVNLYAIRINDNQPFSGEVTFRVRDDTWFDKYEELLGIQPPDDNVHRQGFVFRDEGNYIITAQFMAGGEPYIIDFPLRVGNPASLGPIGVMVGLIAAVLVAVNLVQRKRLLRTKIRTAREDKRT
jgi:hypothetical protein